MKEKCGSIGSDQDGQVRQEEKRRRPQRRFIDVVKKDMRRVGVAEKNARGGVIILWWTLG